MNTEARKVRGFPQYRVLRCYTGNIRRTCREM